MASIIKNEAITVASSWEEIKEKAIIGGIQANDQIMIEFDGKPTLFDVIGVNVDKPVKEYPGSHGCLTIQMHDLAEERSFDTKGNWGSNVWKDSKIREYLNSDEFKNRFTDLTDHIVPVWKENNSSEPTADLFFLLSVEEMDPEKTPYPFYQNERNRVKFSPDDRTDWHWSRSAHRGYAYSTWNVNSAGNVGTYYASSANRFAPGCVVIF